MDHFSNLTDSPLLQSIDGATQTVTGITLLFIWWYACRHPSLLESGLSLRLMAYNTLRLLGLTLATALLIIPDSVLAGLSIIVFCPAWLIAQHRFRRGMDVSPPNHNVGRILLFTDCVVGFAITLAVAQIEPPPLEKQFSSQQISHEFLDNVPRLASYFYGFFVIGAYWFAHYTMFRFIKRYDSWLVLLNFCFLLCAILMFIPIMAFSFYLDNWLASRVYYISQAIILLALTAT
jgi:hypothetical protein